MPDSNLIFGELDERGGIKRNVFVCAVSGQPIEPGDAMITVPGTRRFYRVKATVYWHMRDEVKADLEAQARSMDARTLDAPIISGAEPGSFTADPSDLSAIVTPKKGTK